MFDSTPPPSDRAIASVFRRDAALPARPPSPDVEAAGRSDAGRVRALNEDRFAVVDHLGLYMIADGMGGHPDGDVAATLALEAVAAYFAETEVFGAVDPDRREIEARFAGAVTHANQRVFEAAAEGTVSERMGTTFAGVFVRGARLCVAHVGDSRVYRLRGGKLDQLTEDHSFESFCRAHGVLRPLLEGSPQLGALTRAIGLHETVEVDTRVEEVKPGDLLLLCTDGLWSVLRRAEMAAVLAAQPDLAAAAEELIANANRRGGPDNATCVLVRLRA